MSASVQSRKNDVVVAQKPIRCLVIQMARLGDTLQSLMALRAAKQLYPQLEIHLVVRERFAAAAQRTPWIASVTVFPSDEILGPILNGEKEKQQALGDLARWLSPLIQSPWDLVLNWTYSESSSYLTRLIPAFVKLGYSRGNDQSLSTLDGWSQFIQGVVQGLVPQNIHLTDVLTTQLLTALQIHWGDPANEGESAVTSKSFFHLELGAKDLAWNDKSKKWIGIQLGAGHSAKTWPTSNWAKLVRLLLDRHPEVNLVLMGGKDETTLAREFMTQLAPEDSERKRILSLVGETDFDLWASVVGRCNWVMAGDTAAIHLASVLGTRVLNLSVGPVQCEQTGPYGNGHYVVASSLPCEACQQNSFTAEHSCRQDLLPEAVYGVWSYGQTEWAHRRQSRISEHFKELGFATAVHTVQAFRSRIRGAHEGGGVVYETIQERTLSMNQWTSLVYGHIARAWYCGWMPPIGAEIRKETLSPSLIKQMRSLEESANVLLRICKEGQRSAEELRELSGKMKSQKIMAIRERQVIQDLGKKLMELDSLVQRTGKTQPALAGFSNLSTVLMHNLKGDAIQELGQSTAQAYKQLAEGLQLMKDWIQHTLNLAKPAPVRTSLTKELSL